MPLLTSRSRESVQAPEQAVACLLSALQSPPLLLLVLLNAKDRILFVYIHVCYGHKVPSRLSVSRPLPSKVPRRSLIFQLMKLLTNPDLLPVFFMCDLLHAETRSWSGSRRLLPPTMDGPAQRV